MSTIVDMGNEEDDMVVDKEMYQRLSRRLSYLSLSNLILILLRV